MTNACRQTMKNFSIPARAATSGRILDAFSTQRSSELALTRSRRSITTDTSASSDSQLGALHGLKVLDLSRVLAAPFCTQILADYGADVIKVEEVKKGDDTRYWRASGEHVAWTSDAGPMSNYFSSVNRNKRAITLDLKQRKGKEIFKTLAAKADVVVENFKPGTMDRLEIGYKILSEINPRLIYASVSGYGTTGPYARKGGYDPIAAAEAGLLHITGEQSGPPVRTGIGMVDMATGLYTHGAILAALQARNRTGRGQRVDASLFETQISLLTNVGMSWLNMGIEAQRWGCAHPNIAPYDGFRTADAYLVCGATNDKQFVTLCELLGLDDLLNDDRFGTNPKRVENRDVLGQIFSDVFAQRTTSEWVEIFEKTDLAFAPINNMERTFAHPQTAATNMVTRIPMKTAASGELNLIGPAIKFSDTKPRIRTAPPKHSQHTAEVLAELGLSEAEVATLKEEAII